MIGGASVLAGEGAGSLAGDVADPSLLRAAETFEVFYRREYPRMLKLAYALSGNRWAAEEIAQDAFVAAHRKWNKISAYERPGAWVRRVVSNLAVSFVRRRLIEAKALVKLAALRNEPLPHLPEPDEEVWSAVRSLPKQQAQAVALHYILDLPLAEIAVTLECAESTVKAHLYRARNTLAARLRTNEVES
jgi:RNA polymerase sigma-70 factor (ECF subfamily)